MTIVPLALNSTTAPPFAYVFTLDKAAYLGSVTWNVAAQRYYFQLQDSNSTVVWNGPLIGSPLTYNIPLAPGIFTSSTIVFQEDSGQFVVTP